MSVILIDIVLGFLLLRLGVVFYNYVTQPVLLESSDKLPEASGVSLLVPARNEENNIGTLLKNLLELPDNNILEVLVLDDHSTDNTAQITKRYGLISDKVKLIAGLPLPDGWLGKNWACHQLALQGRGDLLLFIDADVEIAPQAITNAAKRMDVFDLDLLSLFPDQKMFTTGEKAIVPLMHYLLLSLLPLRLVRTLSFPSLSAANGQFMLFRSLTYHSYRFHALVKDNVLDDVSIMKLIKQNKKKGEVLLANNHVFCRMYSSGKEAFAGFSKNLFPGFGSNIMGMQLYFLLIFWLPVLLWPHFLGWQKLVFISMILFIRIMISLLSRQPVLTNLIFHPLQMVAYTSIGLNSMFLHLTNRVQWKGRKLK